MPVVQNTWIWPAALYLFLGGLSAGLYLVAGSMCVLRLRRFARVYRTAFLACAAMLAAGLGCLLIELVKPGQAFVVWQSFSNTSSWMMWGAWAAMGCIAVFTLTGVFELPGPSGWLRDALAGVPYLREGLRVGFVALGMAGAAFITVYTGFLLTRAGGVPFWNSSLLPALFCVSAVSAGLSATMALGVALNRMGQLARQHRKLLTAVSLALATAEAVLLALFLAKMLAGGGFVWAAQQQVAATSAWMLVGGRYAWAFWLCVPALGIAVPGVVFAVGGFTRVRVPDGVLLACALLSVLSDAALRFLILYAGTYADWFAVVLGNL